MASEDKVALPNTIVSPGDVQKLRRELEAIDDFLHQAGLRQGGKAVKMPACSRLLEDLADSSGLNLLQKGDRERLLRYLVLLLQKAPVLHISFASDPSMTFLGKLMAWLRNNIHPQVLVSVGLQPSIAAGCIVRTANQQFDFSLRQAFSDQKSVLIDTLKQQSAPDKAQPVKIAVTEVTQPEQPLPEKTDKQEVAA